MIGVSATTSNANLAALINAPYTTTSEGVALSNANADKIKSNSRITATATATTVALAGSGRLIVAEGMTSGTFSTPILHAYYGKMGAIDLVVQDLSEVDMRETSDRRGTNVFSSYLAGIKTFSDGAKQFLDVQIL